jgi:hypothetical protein
MALLRLVSCFLLLPLAMGGWGPLWLSNVGAAIVHALVAR